MSAVWGWAGSVQRVFGVFLLPDADKSDADESELRDVKLGLQLTNIF